MAKERRGGVGRLLLPEVLFHQAGLRVAPKLAQAALLGIDDTHGLPYVRLYRRSYHLSSHK